MRLCLPRRSSALPGAQTCRAPVAPTQDIATQPLQPPAVARRERNVRSESFRPVRTPRTPRSEDPTGPPSRQAAACDALASRRAPRWPSGPSATRSLPGVRVLVIGLPAEPAQREPGREREKRPVLSPRSLLPRHDRGPPSTRRNRRRVRRRPTAPQRRRRRTTLEGWGLT